MIFYLVRFDHSSREFPTLSTEITPKLVESVEEIEEEFIKKFLKNEGILEKSKERIPKKSLLRFLDLVDLFFQDEGLRIKVAKYGDKAYAISIDLRFSLEKKQKEARYSCIIISKDPSIKPIGNIVRRELSEEEEEEISKALSIDKEEVYLYVLYILYIYALTIELGEALMELVRELRSIRVEVKDIKDKDAFLNKIYTLRKSILAIATALDRIHPKYLRSFGYIDFIKMAYQPLGPRLVKLLEVLKDSKIARDIYGRMDTADKLTNEALITLDMLLRTYQIEYEILDRAVEEERERYESSIPLLILTALSSVFLAADGLIAVYPIIKDRLAMIGFFLLGSRAAYGILIALFEPDRAPIEEDIEAFSYRIPLGIGAVVAYAYILIRYFLEISRLYVVTFSFFLYLASKKAFKRASVRKFLLYSVLSPISAALVIGLSYYCLSCSGFLGRLLVHRGLAMYEKEVKVGENKIRFYRRNVLYDKSTKDRPREKRLRVLRA